MDDLFLLLIFAFGFVLALQVAEFLYMFWHWLVHRMDQPKPRRRQATWKSATKRTTRHR